MTVRELYEYAKEHGYLDYVITLVADPFGFRGIMKDQIVVTESCGVKELHIC